MVGLALTVTVDVAVNKDTQPAVLVPETVKLEVDVGVLTKVEPCTV